MNLCEKVKIEMVPKTAWMFKKLIVNAEMRDGCGDNETSWNGFLALNLYMVQSHVLKINKSQF